MVYVTVIFGSDPKLAEITLSPTVIAFPFKELNKFAGPGNYIENDTDEDEEEENPEEGQDEVADSGAMRISTRARIPYDLARYSMNAMLLLNATRGYTRDSSDCVSERMALVTETFRGFRFEVETHENIADEQLNEICEHFFQRDFSECGCVAVVVLTLDDFDEDRVITRRFQAGSNPSLKNKPKLYLIESSRQFRFRASNPLFNGQGRRFSPGSETQEDCPDCLSLELPAMLHRVEGNQPLKTFCEKLNDMADVDHIITIIKESIRAMKPMFRNMIYVYSTLERQMFLHRTESTVTRL